MVYNCVKQYGWDSCSWLCEHPDWLLVAPTLGCVNTWKLYRTMGWTSGCVGSQDDCWCHEFRNAIAHMMPISWYSMTSLHISHAWQFLDSEVRGGLLVKSPQKRLWVIWPLHGVNNLVQIQACHKGELLKGLTPGRNDRHVHCDWIPNRVQ